MKIACISDIHGQFSKIKLPIADTLVIAGDFCNNHSHVWNSDVSIQGIWLETQFIPMCQNLLAKKIYKDIVVIPGNHDRVFQTRQEDCKKLFAHNNLHLLIDEGVSIDGKYFWGSPWTPWFHGDYWAFNHPHKMIDPFLCADVTKETWSLIPSETDVLITHGPPWGYLDECQDGHLAGCKYLAEEIFKRVKPSVHIFGHIHEGYGSMEQDGIKFINASVCTLQYKPTNEIQVITI